MIIDKLENIKLYTNIPIEAINFIQNLNSSVKLGRHEISDRVYANVEKYTTKSLAEGRFEAHRNYIDIQILLCGSEKIYLSELAGLKVSESYDKNRDIEFYSSSIKNSFSVTLDGTNFIVIYPHEAHAPQVVAQYAQEVLKVVVKVKL